MRILVVEDDERLAATLKRGLEAEDFVVDVASSGTSGLALAREVDYDLLILDIMLPGMNGQKLCATLRAESYATPIMMLTAKGGEYDEADSLDLGADDFLSKPFSYPVLIARVRALLRRRSRPTIPSVVRAGDISLDMTTHLCERGGHEVVLTAKEAGILEYLFRNINQVVSKDQLIEHQWDIAFEGTQNVVEVHVSALRRKLGSDVIETVRGSGYRVNARPN
jgi:DNA-binding response OmpR family regulator